MLQWANRVVGGIDDPRFLLCGPELSPNRSFEDDLTAVGGTVGAYSQLFDVTTPFGDYVLKVEDDNAGVSEYATITIDTGAAIASKLFIISFYARNDEDAGQLNCYVDIPALTNDHLKEFTVDENWRMYFLEVACTGADTGNNLVVYFYPADYDKDVSGLGAMRIDNFRIRQVVDYFELPLPSRGNFHQTLQKVTQAQNELADGSEKSYYRGIKYSYNAYYEQLSAAQEILRSKLINTNYDILFFPHKDAEVAWLVRWDKEYEREWAEGVAPLGHAGNIDLVGTELIQIVPDVIIDATTEYQPSQDEFIWEGEEYLS